MPANQHLWLSAGTQKTAGLPADPVPGFHMRQQSRKCLEMGTFCLLIEALEDLPPSVSSRADPARDLPV
jgi:hypothetical protein